MRLFTFMTTTKNAATDTVTGVTARGWLLRRLLACGAAAMVVTALMPPAPAAAVDNVPVTIQLTRFDILTDPDPAPTQGDGDFYATISFGNGASTTTAGEVTTNDPFTPPSDWGLTTSVDRDAQSTLTATVRIFDADSGAAAPDDEVDLDPHDNQLALDFTIDLNTGSFFGPDITTNHGYVVGDDDTAHTGTFEGGEAGELSFSVGLGPSTDIDGDGIPSDVERFGIRNADGSMHTDMAALGADACRKTIAVEMDYLQAPDHDHEPDPAALAEVVASFDAAPIDAVDPCPYGAAADGVNFIVDVDDAIPMSADDEDEPFDLNDLAAQRATDFDSQRDPYFFYNVWAHTHNGESSSGVCCQAKGFLVTLGLWSGGNGTVRDQAGTIMHELGHNLGLGHGGGDGVNYKPNYLSIMNYRYQVIGLVDFDAWAAAGGAAETYVPNAVIDYSRAALASLDETALDEPAGIGGPNTAVYWSDPSNTVRLSDARLPVDWNFDGDATDTGITVDLNDDICIDWGNDGDLDTTAADDDVAATSVIRTGPDRQCDSTAAGNDKQVMAVGATQPAVLTGFDDWDNIAFAGQINAGLGGHTGPLAVDEVTFEQAEQIKAELVKAANEAPTADAGADASVAEGSTVMLDGTGSHDPDGDELTYQWEPADHLDDPTSPTPVYSGVDDTVDVLTLTVTDPLGLSDSDTVAVTVTNVEPTVTAVGDSMDESGVAQVSATFTDPGVIDVHTATIDWGDGTSEPVTLTQGAGSGSLTATHTYGDDGNFPVTVTVVDDDHSGSVDGTGADGDTVTVGNVDPSVALDTGEAITFPGGEAFVTEQGVSTDHSADATDDGSDDLTFTWGFGPATTYLNNGVSADPDPSPFGTFPFAATDTAAAPAANVGVDAIDIEVDDDDGGSDAQQLARIVTGVADRTEGSGWWQHQYTGNGNPQLDADLLEAYLEIVRFVSNVFSEEVPLATLGDAADALRATGDDRRAFATAELLGAWLHFASGGVGHDASVPLGGGSSAEYLSVLADVEQVVSDPSSTPRELGDAAQRARATRHAQ